MDNTTKGIAGEDWTYEEEDELVIVGLNSNGLKTESWQQKNDAIRDFLLQAKADLIAVQEANVNWNKVSAKDQWEERTLG